MLTAVLLRDPTSWLATQVNGWKYPVSNEWVMLAHTYDLIVGVNSTKKQKPIPKPWSEDGAGRIGSNKRQSRSSVLNILERMNPKESNG